jgi:hypothetical protein
VGVGKARVEFQIDGARGDVEMEFAESAVVVFPAAMIFVTARAEGCRIMPDG